MQAATATTDSATKTERWVVRLEVRDMGGWHQAHIVRVDAHDEESAGVAAMATVKGSKAYRAGLALPEELW